MQEPQPLGRHLRGEKIDAGCVAAGPGEAGDKTKPDRVIADTEDDRDRRCCSFGRERRRDVAGRGDHGHLSADQIGQQRRQAIVLDLQPVVLDRDVLAFDVAGFVEAFAERGHKAGVGIGRPVSDKPDHRQRRLLRPRRKRPRNSRTAEQRDEFASPHIRSQPHETQHCIGSNEYFDRGLPASKPLPQCTANVADGSLSARAIPRRWPARSGALQNRT